MFFGDPAPNMSSINHSLGLNKWIHSCFGVPKMFIVQAPTKPLGSLLLQASTLNPEPSEP